MPAANQRPSAVLLKTKREGPFLLANLLCARKNMMFAQLWSPKLPHTDIRLAGARQCPPVSHFFLPLFSQEITTTPPCLHHGYGIASSSTRQP